MKRVVTLLVLVWLGCDVTRPTAGDLQIRLSTPNTDDRGAQLTIQCSQDPVAPTAAAGYTIYSVVEGSTVKLIVVRAANQSLPSQSVVATLKVSDVDQPCTADVDAVAIQGYGLRTSLAGYAASVLNR
jgi:hypothetical protein